MQSSVQIAIPPLSMIEARLAKLSQSQVKKLSQDTGVPFGTLMKIRHGITKNPGIETVRMFFPLLLAMTDEGK